MIDEKVPITDPIIEPSLEENVNVAIDSDNVGVVKNPDTETEKSELPNRYVVYMNTNC